MNSAAEIWKTILTPAGERDDSPTAVSTWFLTIEPVSGRRPVLCAVPPTSSGRSSAPPLSAHPWRSAFYELFAEQISVESGISSRRAGQSLPRQPRTKPCRCAPSTP